MQELFFQLIGLLGVRLGVTCSPVGMVELFVHGASLTTQPLATTNPLTFMLDIPESQIIQLNHLDIPNYSVSL